jgi:hypothetical protein
VDDLLAHLTNTAQAIKDKDFVETQCVKVIIFYIMLIELLFKYMDLIHVSYDV